MNHHNEKLLGSQAVAFLLRLDSTAATIAPIPAKAQVPGSGTALIVIRPPVMVGFGPVVPEGVAKSVYSLLPSVI